MNLRAIVAQLQNCPCGRVHDVAIDDVRIEQGLVHRAGEVLLENNFPRRILLVADDNTLRAADGITASLALCGYQFDLRRYENLRTAHMQQVDQIAAQLAGYDGVLSVGTGSLNDICRLAAYKADVPFAIFATAPSMDGFASCTAPITVDNFKRSYPARQPSVILADTDILAAAPGFLKAAGFGDVIGKFVALVDWQASALVTGEYVCDAILRLTRQAVQDVASAAPQISKNDPRTAQKLMEALVITGIAMTFAGCTRPASGAEHIVSHFWEIQKLAAGEISDFHGKKVGIASIIVAGIYHKLAGLEQIEPVNCSPDWNAVEAAYGANFMQQIRIENNPPLTERIDCEALRRAWPQIRSLIRRELPTREALLAMMQAAGAATRPCEADVDDDLARRGIRYSGYMRDRFTLLRIMPMLGLCDWMVP